MRAWDAYMLWRYALALISIAYITAKKDWHSGRLYIFNGAGTEKGGR